MIKNLKKYGSATKVAVKAFKHELIISKERILNKQYLDKICDALYLLPDNVDYSGVNTYILNCIELYEKEYGVKYKHKFIAPENTVA